MPRPQDDARANKDLRQVARRYFETEMVALHHEVADSRAEVARLRAALEQIEMAEPPSHDGAGRSALIESLRSIAREALSTGDEASNR